MKRYVIGERGTDFIVGEGCEMSETFTSLSSAMEGIRENVEGLTYFSGENINIYELRVVKRVKANKEIK